MNVTKLFDGDTFEHGGRTFVFKVEADDTADPPWEEFSGHGPVSDWTTHAKEPGEILLVANHSGMKRYYHWQRATEIAREDDWGIPQDDIDAWTQKVGRKPTRGMIVNEAVRRDFQYLRDWCDDKWSYVGVIVSLADDPNMINSLWRIESNADDYMVSVAEDLADNLNRILDQRMADEIEASRPDLAPPPAKEFPDLRTLIDVPPDTWVWMGNGITLNDLKDQGPDASHYRFCLNFFGKEPLL